MLADLHEFRSAQEIPALLRDLNETIDLLRTLPSGASPPELAHGVHRIVRERLGSGEPYLRVKSESTDAALAMYERLTALVATSGEPLETAVRLSIAGNVIDTGVQVLFLADNAGETVFDRVLVEELATHVTYVVKAGPVLNDATRADALAAGLDRCATIADNGSEAPRTVVDLCSPEFRDRLCVVHDCPSLALVRAERCHAEMLRSPPAQRSWADCFVIPAAFPICAHEAPDARAPRTAASSRSCAQATSSAARRTVAVRLAPTCATHSCRSTRRTTRGAVPSVAGSPGSAPCPRTGPCQPKAHSACQPARSGPASGVRTSESRPSRCPRSPPRHAPCPFRATVLLPDLALTTSASARPL